MVATLRVLTFNVRQLRDDPAAVREVLATSGADVVAVQEPPRGPRGAGRLRRLAGAAGFGAVVVGGGTRTTALLVRDGLSVTGRRAVRLPWRPGRTRRGLAVADVEGVRVVSAHLSLVPAERARHLVRLLRVVASAPGRGCVVAGDLNEDPDGPTRQTLVLHLHEVTTAAGPTFTASHPRRRLDAILVSRGVTATRVHVVGPPELVRRASDHLPVVADLHLP